MCTMCEPARDYSCVNQRGIIVVQHEVGSKNVQQRNCVVLNADMKFTITYLDTCAKDFRLFWPVCMKNGRIKSGLYGMKWRLCGMETS